MKVRKGISYCPKVSFKLILRTEKDEFYFGYLETLLNRARYRFWTEWGETRDEQVKGSGLVAPLSVLFWSKEND